MVLDEACVFVEDSSQQFQNTVSSLGSEGKKCLRCLCWFSKTTEPHLTTERAVQIPKYGQIRTESRLIRSLSPASDVPVLLLNQPIFYWGLPVILKGMSEAWYLSRCLLLRGLKDLTATLKYLFLDKVSFQTVGMPPPWACKTNIVAENNGCDAAFTSTIRNYYSIFLSPVLLAFNFLHKQNRKWSKKYDMETSVFVFFFRSASLAFGRRLFCCPPIKVTLESRLKLPESPSFLLTWERTANCPI